MIIYRSFCDSHRLKLRGDSFFSFLNGKSRKFLGIDKAISTSEIFSLFKRLLGYVNVSQLFVAVNYLDHIYIMSDSILKVALVVRGDCHYRTCSVACKNEIADKHSYLFAIDGIYAGNSLELTARFRLVELCAVHIVLLQGLCDIRLDLRLVLYPRHKRFDDISVGSKHHKGYTVDRFNTGGEYGKFSAADYLKLDLDTCGLAYPVLLHKLCGFGPIYLIKSFKKLLCKGGLIDYPLLHILADYGVSAAL